MTEGKGYWQRRISRRRTLQGAALAGAGLTAATLLACSGGDGPAGSGSTTSTGPKKGGVFEAVDSSLAGAFPDFHKSTAFFSDGLTLFPWVYSGILRWDLQGLPEPELASLPEITDGGARLVFRFRDGIKWQPRQPANGREFTSEDARKTIERIMDPSTTSTRRVNYSQVDSLETPDKKTLILKLKEPDAALVLNLGFFDMIIPMEQATGAAQFRTAADVCGTGPYTLESYDEVAGAAFKRRPDGYWKPDKAHVDEYRLTFAGPAGNEANHVNALRAGKADRGRVTPEEYEAFQKDRRFELEKTTYDLKFAVVMNPQRDPFKDARVRHAVSLAIERQLMVQNAWGGLAEMTGPISPGLPAWALPESELITYGGYRKDRNADLTEARSLLSAAGLPNGFEDTLIWVLPVNQNQADAIVPNLARIGIRLRSQSAGPALPALLQRFNEGNFTIAQGGFLPGLEPHAQIATFNQTGGSRNYGQYSDPELDRMIAAARREFDNAKRKTMYLDIQRYILKGMTTNFAWHTSQTVLYAHRTYVKMPTGAGHLYIGWQMAEDLYLDGKA